MAQYEAIIAIMNSGYIEEAVNVTRELGAKGGTVINARGTVSKDAEKHFGITINEEKEILLIVVNSNIKEQLLNALYDAIGTSTPAQGIAFSIPVDEAVGLKF